MPEIREIVAQIDTSTTAVSETRIFRLEHADAVELADIVNGLYTDQTNSNNNQGRRGQNDQRRGFGGFPFGGGGPFGDRGQSAPGSAQSERALQQARVMAIGDPRTNSLVVTASRESMMQIAEMVGRLDATDAKKQRVFVHSLEHADAENVAAVLRGMFGDTTGANTRAGGQTTSRLLERTTTGATTEAAEAMNTGRATR
jgi:hypothetical protein